MLGQHLTFSTYGFWLPNDPRGSGSDRVRAQHLFEAGGEATKATTRHSVASRPHDHRLRLRTKEALKHAPVVLTGRQALAIARGIAAVIEKFDLRVHALAIMPDHVHAVVANSALPPDEVIPFLKRAGTRGLNAEKIHPFRDEPRSNGRLPSPWAEHGWKVFLDTPNDMRRAIAYVEQNPVQAGLKPQRWWFVRPFEG